MTTTVSGGDNPCVTELIDQAAEAAGARSLLFTDERGAVMRSETSSARRTDTNIRRVEDSRFHPH